MAVARAAAFLACETAAIPIGEYQRRLPGFRKRGNDRARVSGDAGGVRGKQAPIHAQPLPPAVTIL